MNPGLLDYSTTFEGLQKKKRKTALVWFFLVNFNYCKDGCSKINVSVSVQCWKKHKFSCCLLCLSSEVRSLFLFTNWKRFVAMASLMFCAQLPKSQLEVLLFHLRRHFIFPLILKKMFWMQSDTTRTTRMPNINSVCAMLFGLCQQTRSVQLN